MPVETRASHCQRRRWHMIMWFRRWWAFRNCTEWKQVLIQMCLQYPEIDTIFQRMATQQCKHPAFKGKRISGGLPVVIVCPDCDKRLSFDEVNAQTVGEGHD